VELKFGETKIARVCDQNTGEERIARGKTREICSRFSFITVTSCDLITGGAGKEAARRTRGNNS
jgi:hypothetical protein